MIKKLLFFLLIPFYGFGQLCSDEDTVLLQRATTAGYTTATLTGTAGGSAGVSWAVKYVRTGQTDTITTSFTASITKNLTGLYSGVQYKFRYLTFCGSTTQGNLGYGSFNTTTTEVQYTPMTAPGYQFKYLKADSGIAMPIRDTSTGRGTTRPGPFVINSADSMPYFWNGVYWKPFALDSAGLQAQINLKVDSVTVSGDSLFYWVNGTGYGQVITGLNAVTLQEVFDTETGTAVMNKDNTIDASLYNFTINSDSLKASGALRLTGYGTGGHTGTGAYYLRVDSDGKVIEENPTITIPLSSLTAATASNTINNANNKQTWQWNSLSGTGLLLSTTSTAAAASAQKVLEITSSGANSNISQSTYGIHSTNTHTGTISSNYGGYFSASGASLNNIGVYGIATGTNGYGVYGAANTGKGIYGGANGGYAFYGVSSGSSGSVTAAYFESSGATTTNIALRLKAANSVNNIALAVENGEGSVGIGTLTPAAVFHTVGTVRMASMGSASTDTTTYKPMGISSLGDVIPMSSWYGSGGGASGLTIGTTSISSGTVGRILFEGSGNVLQQSSNLFWDNSNISLGIGTSSPAAEFNLIAGNGDFRMTKSLSGVVPSMGVINTSGLAAAVIAGTSGSGFCYDNGANFYIISENHSAFTSNNLGSGAVRVTISGTGEVGINTTSPGEKLEVSGNIKASGKIIARNIIYRTLNASDADFTAAVGTAYVLPDPSTGRTITLPTGQDADKILFYLTVSPSNSWNLSTNVTILDGSTVNKLDTYGPGAIYLIYDGANSVWRLIPNM